MMQSNNIKQKRAKNSTITGTNEFCNKLTDGKIVVIYDHVKASKTVLKKPIFCSFFAKGNGHNGKEYNNVKNIPTKTKGIKNSKPAKKETVTMNEATNKITNENCSLTKYG